MEGLGCDEEVSFQPLKFSVELLRFCLLNNYREDVHTKEILDKPNVLTAEEITKLTGNVKLSWIE